MQTVAVFSVGNILKPEENSSRVRNPLPSESSESNTFSSSSALRGSSPFNLCQKGQKKKNCGTNFKDVTITVAITTVMRVL